MKFKIKYMEQEYINKNLNENGVNTINTVSTSELPIVKSRKSYRRFNRKKLLKLSLGLGGVFLLLLLTTYYLLLAPAYAVYQDGMRLWGIGRELKTAVSEQNLTQSKEQINNLKTELVSLEKDYGRLKICRYLPLIHKYYQDGEAIIDAAGHGAVAAELLVSGLEPFADILGFSSDQAKQEDISADQKLEELVQILPQLLPSLDGALVEIDEMEQDLGEINPDDYPQQVLGFNVKEKVAQVKEISAKVKETGHDIRPFLEKLPEAMGEPEAKNYLVLFQNDKELRPTGGFITAYAIISLDRGRFKIVRSEDIYNIDHNQSYVEAPQAIKEYLVPAFYMRDTNFSPDFKVSMQTFDIYWNNLSELPEIAGIIGVDTEFVRSFLEVLGPIYLPQYGETFEASNIVYELELYSEKILQGPYRKNLLGDLMGAMVDRVFVAKKNEWRPLIDKAIEEISRKHMLFYFHDETMQNFGEKYNFAGRIKDFDGDYLHVNDANLGGLKSDYWVEREVKQKIRIEEDGSVIKEVEITYNNKGTYDGWLNAATRTYTRIYVPKDSELISSEGGDYGSNARVFEDLGKTVFANFTRTKPQTSETIRFVYKLPFKITGTGFFSQKEYKLLVQKQAGLGQPQPDLKRPHYTIEINGEIKADYELLTDNEFDWTL